MRVAVHQSSLSLSILSPKRLRDAIRDHQLLARLETLQRNAQVSALFHFTFAESESMSHPPKVPHPLVQGGRKHGVDVAKDALVILERELSSQEPHYGFEAL